LQGSLAAISNENAAALANGDRQAIMINITCLAGMYAHPTTESLTEAMLWNPTGGAVAALGATSLTLPVNQAHLSQALAEAMQVETNQTLGDMLLAAQRSLPRINAGVQEVLETFLLFGDPALRLPGP